MKTKLIILLCLLVVGTGLGRPKRRPRPSRWAIGPYLELAFPVSKPENSIKSGEGVGAKLKYLFPHKPYFALRGDFGYLSFGETRFYGDYYSLAQLRSEAFRLLLGPQFQTQLKRFKFYLAPMVGVYNYRTVLSYQYAGYGYGSSYGFSETTDSHTRVGWLVNAGVMFDIRLGPWVDISLKYHDRRSDIKTDEGGVVPRDELSVNIGVVFFLKR